MSLSPSEAEEGVPSSSQRSRNALDWGWWGVGSQSGSESESGSPQPPRCPNPICGQGLGSLGTAAPSLSSSRGQALGGGGGSPLPGTFRCCSCRRSSSSCRRLFSISACFFRFSWKTDRRDGVRTRQGGPQRPHQSTQESVHRDPAFSVNGTHLAHWAPPAPCQPVSQPWHKGRALLTAVPPPAREPERARGLRFHILRAKEVSQFLLVGKRQQARPSHRSPGLSVGSL